MKFGLNLYSLRERIQTEEGLEAVSNELWEAGYTFLQFSGSSLPLSAVKRISQRTGMPVYLTHSDINRIFNDTDKLMQEHSALGCFNIGIGCMPDPFAEEAELEKLAEKMERTGAYMASRGFRLFYHHHHYEFFRISSGETVLEYLARMAPHLNFTLDTYWIQYGGGDVLAIIEKLSGRIGCVHLKDYRIVRNREKEELEPAFACLGEGTLDFGKIIPAMKMAGTELFFVEQDNAGELPDGMDQLRKSADYLKNY